MLGCVSFSQKLKDVNNNKNENVLSYYIEIDIS